MKILHIVNEGLAGGVLRVALEESRYLNKSGFQSLVLLLFDTKTPKGFIGEHSIAKVYYLHKNFLPKVFQDFGNPVLREIFGALEQRVPKFIEKFKPDTVILHNLTAVSLAITIKKKLGSKIALYIHNPTSPPSLSNLVNKFRKSPSMKKFSFIIPFIDLVLTSSKKMKQFIRKSYGLDAYVLPPGCSPCEPEELEKHKWRVILIPQRLSIGKRVVKIAEMLAKEVDTPVIFAGSSHYITPLVLKRLRKTGLRKYYVIVNVGEHDLLKLYRKSLLTFSIIKEPFGMHIIESTSQGTAPIAPREAGASELFQHGVHGLFFKDLNEATEYVATLISDEELAIKLGLNAWKVCRERYMWTNHTDLLIKILEKAK